ncbi:hypothetical protein P3W45_001023 [Vairimorpha bombi]|jgi:histone-binding protein RBBP4
MVETDILEEYKIWRKNVPFIYDLMFSHTLKWPSLSVQYFPETKRDNLKAKTTQRLLLSTNSNNIEQEYIQIASVDFPDKYDESLSEDCYGDLRFKIEQSIPVSESVNTVKYNPNAWHILAARFDTEDVHIFDYTKHLAYSRQPNPDIVLKGHTKGGFGLSWNPNLVSELSTCGEDNLICIFDISQDGKEIYKKTCLSKHKNVVNDVCYNYFSENVLVSVSDDKSLIMWDTKSKEPSSMQENAHDLDILSAHFSPLNSFYLATSSADKSVKIWDTRNMKTSTHTLLTHSGAVERVEWSPHSETILASSGRDRRVCLWDLSLTGSILSEEDASDGPPELLFIHGGHTNNVFDISWNPSELFEIASVSEDNILQIWQIPERE